MAARLLHPNIVTAYDAGESHGVHYLVMEHVEGSDLSALVRNHGRLPVATALDYHIQAARGLEYAHSQNVIHRDIKPSNLLLDNKGRVKVLDMGLARINDMVGAYDPTAEQTLTGTGEAMGTVDYMPPEQAENTKTVDERADIYSLGCTLFYLLSGRAVYGGDRTIQKLFAHREAPIPSLLAECPEVPEKLDTVFQKMVAKRPQDRYGSMTEVIAELQQCAAPRPEQFAETASFEGQSPSSSQVVTQPVIATEETPADDSFPLDFPVISPVDGLHRAHPKRTPPSKRQIIIGSVVAAVACLIVVVMGSILAFKSPNGTSAEVEASTESPDDDVPEKPFPEPGPAKTQAASPAGIGVQFPPLAIAPFTPEEAKQHQQAWANHLGVLVVETNSIGMQMTLIPPGDFMMGSTEDEIAEVLQAAVEEYSETTERFVRSEGPQHKVRITRPFYLTAQRYCQMLGVSFLVGGAFG